MITLRNLLSFRLRHRTIIDTLKIIHWLGVVIYMVIKLNYLILSTKKSVSKSYRS